MFAKLTPRFHAALAYASMIHDDQVRKGDAPGKRRKGEAIPYVAHLLGVCALALSNGADETEAIAALLHDAAEDQGGEDQLRRIAGLFGDEVARIVRGCSDSMADVTKGEVKEPFEPRRRRYLAHLEADADASILLVSASDKVDNLRAIVRDYDRVGERLWERFSGRRDGTIWYYETLVCIFRDKARRDSRLEPLARELAELFKRLPARDPAYGTV